LGAAVWSRRFMGMVFSGNGKKVKFSDFFTFLLFEFLNFLPFAEMVLAGERALWSFHSVIYQILKFSNFLNF
jgi:hypothetical protein